MPLPVNHVRKRLAEGGLALGFGVHHLRGSAVGMIAAASGFDWLFIDMEHGAMSVDDATQIAIAALAQGVTPIVRVCKDAVFEGTRALDNGAMGVVVPHVDTAEEAAEVARAYRFPPTGMRSWGGPPFAYGMQAVNPAEAQVELNDNILLACMIETPEAVQNVEAIAAVPGVDVLMFGTSDLTATMGIAGQIGHPDVRKAYEKVAANFDDHANDVAMRDHAYGRGRALYEAVGATRSFETTPYPSTHNLGTNRMSENPRDGVVDRFGKAHDMPNLYVSDGSQFTTGAACNPTLTIVALAMRQAEHIAGRMARGEV